MSHIKLTSLKITMLLSGALCMPQQSMGSGAVYALAIDTTFHCSDTSTYLTNVDDLSTPNTSIIEPYTRCTYADKLMYSGIERNIKKAFELCHSISISEAMTYSIRAQAHIWLGDAGAGAHNYIEALELLGINGDRSLLAEAHIGLGNATRGAEQIPHYTRVLLLLGIDGDPYLLAQAHIGVGNATRGSMQITHYQTSLELLGIDGDPVLLAQAHIGLGNATRGSLQISHYKTALKLLGIDGDPSLLAQAHIGLGNAWKGVHHFSTALTLLGDEGDPSLRAKAHIGIGNATRGDDQITHYTIALDLLGKTGNPSLMTQAYIGLGNVMLSRSDSITALTYYYLAKSKDGNMKARKILPEYLENILSSIAFNSLQPVEQEAIRKYFPQLAPKSSYVTQNKKWMTAENGKGVDWGKISHGCVI